jgi:hypothetical protein
MPYNILQSIQRTTPHHRRHDRHDVYLAENLPDVSVSHNAQDRLE